ncbi:hypothetical protein ACMFMF_006908 [Clarireedia jacksonii]
MSNRNFLILSVAIVVRRQDRFSKRMADSVRIKFAGTENEVVFSVVFLMAFERRSWEFWTERLTFQEVIVLIGSPVFKRLRDVRSGGIGVAPMSSKSSSSDSSMICFYQRISM